MLERGRPEIDEKKRRCKLVSALITKDQLEALDRVKGKKTRSDFIRKLINKEISK